MKKVWARENSKQLAQVLCEISDVKTMQNFLRDVMTEKEIIEIAARLEAAKMLAEGEKYQKITNETKLSSRTVARISDWLQNGCNGYREAITLINHHNLAS